MIAEIVPEKRTNVEKDTFSYKIPKELIDKIQIGSICTIPFGKKTVRGVVFKLDNDEAIKNIDFEIKNIKSVSQDFIIPDNYLNTARWVSEYYLCSLGEAISLFLPPDIRRPRSPVSSIKNQVLRKEQIKLTPEQERVFQKLKKLLSSDNGATISNQALLHGVTGSGKTELYLRITEENLKLGKQTIVLVPEIMLTPQVVERFEAIFPQEICLIHSGLSQSERFIAYRDFYNGTKNIMIGPRSALLVPSKNLGLIIIDEEQEDAYKQEKSPRYHAIDLAYKINETNNSLLILGTATPRIETYFKAQNNNLKLFELKSRFQKEKLPTSEIVDLKEELKKNNYSPISLELQKKIKNTLENKRQILLLLNRRGMSTFVSCRDCGEVINCPRCSIPLVYHLNQGEKELSCHHCDYKTLPPSVCPNCGSYKIKYFGAGLDKIEKEIERLFSEAKIQKIESKSLQNKGEYQKVYDKLIRHQIDILIGTQILAKGLDIPNVDLVGVVSADTGLHMPQFRASEKTFQILTQVSGRSGRKESVGHTIIQTYWPESNTIKLASKHNFEDFYKEEIKERKALNYPPFCHLIRIITQDKNKTKAKKEIEVFAKELEKKKISFIGPGPCFLSKINFQYRFHLIIKTNKWPDESIRDIFFQNPYITWDVDPVDML